MRTMAYLKRGTDLRNPEIVELSPVDAAEAGYVEGDLVSMAASEERCALEELINRVRSATRDLASIEAKIARMETEGEDDGVLLSARHQRRNLVHLLAANRPLLASTAERAVTLAELERGGPDHLEVDQVRKEADIARSLAADGDDPAADD